MALDQRHLTPRYVWKSHKERPLDHDLQQIEEETAKRAELQEIERRWLQVEDIQEMVREIRLAVFGIAVGGMLIVLKLFNLV